VNPLPDSFTIRPMTMDDLPQVYRIELDSFTLPWPFNSYVFELTESRVSRCFVAATKDKTDHKKILGMIVIYLIDDEAHVATFAIHPEYRRSGIGWRLMLHSLKETCREGATHAFLEVRAGNQTAINLYEKLGFVKVGERKNYYADNHEDAFLMNLEELNLEKLAAVEARFLSARFDQPSGGSHDA
jgi:[ribosomal protein S18]-alanine N-acetyltransferase